MWARSLRSRPTRAARSRAATVHKSCLAAAVSLLSGLCRDMSGRGDTHLHKLGGPPLHQPPCASSGTELFSGTYAKSKRRDAAGSAGRGRRRGQGLNSGLGELKYSKHKADVALPRLHVNQRHMLPLVWQHMCTVYLEDPHCLLFSISTHQDRKEFAPALRCIIPWSLPPPRTDGMKATFNFLTKKDLAVPF